MKQEKKQIKLSDQDALSEGFAKHLKEYMDTLSIGYTQEQCADIAKTVVKTISQLAKDKDVYNYEKGEYTQPDGYEEVIQSVDKLLNRRIHSTTLERIADEFFNYVEKMPAPTIAIHTYKGRDKAMKARLEINTEKEKEKICAYLLKTWDGFSQESVREYVNLVYDEASKLVKPYTQGYALTPSAERIQQKRSDFEQWKSRGYQGSQEDFRQVRHDDILYGFPMALIIGTSSMNNNFLDSWDYEKAVNNLIFQVKPLLPDAGKWRPKGWSKMNKNYEEYGGMEDFSEQDACTAFGGFYSGGAAVGPFPVRISLPHVMYSDKEQGYKPLEVLTGSIVAQVMAVTEHNNDVRLIKLIDALEIEMEKPKYWIGAVKELDFVPQTDDAFVQAMWKVFLSQAAHEDNETLIKDTLQSLGVNTKKRKYR